MVCGGAACLRKRKRRRKLTVWFRFGRTYSGLLSKPARNTLRFANHFAAPHCIPQITQLVRPVVLRNIVSLTQRRICTAGFFFITFRVLTCKTKKKRRRGRVEVESQFYLYYMLLHSTSSLRIGQISFFPYFCFLTPTGY